MEGMRIHEIERNGGVFPTIAAGPLNEIRLNLNAARAFVHTANETRIHIVVPEAKRLESVF